MPFANSNGLKLYYEMEGSGPPLLLIAGTGYGGATWHTGVAKRFVGEGFTLITYDHRGLGKSDKPDGMYSTRQFAADAAGLRKSPGPRFLVREVVARGVRVRPQFTRARARATRDEPVLDIESA